VGRLKYIKLTKWQFCAVGTSVEKIEMNVFTDHELANERRITI
jgi:hypothetical protein